MEKKHITHLKSGSRRSKGMNIEGKEYLTSKEAAEYLGITQAEFSHLKRRHGIQSHHLDKTAHKYVSKEDLDKYLQEQSPAGYMRKFFEQFLTPAPTEA